MSTRIFLIFVFAVTAFGQTQASRFIPLSGTTPPATCTVGELFYDTDAPAGSNLYACTATNTWTLQSGGSGATYPTDLLCKLTVSTTTATFAAGASGTNPCNFQTGTISSPATLVISGSPTAGTYYWETDGSTIRVKAPGTSSGLTPSGLTIVDSASSFSYGGWVPIGTTAYTSGTDWDTTAPDKRPHFSLSMNPVAGTMLTSSDSGIQRTINFDAANLYAVEYCRSTTGNDTYTCGTTPATTAYTRGKCYVLDADTANTGTATVNIDSVGARSILNRAGAALSDGDITANKPISVCDDGTQLIIQGDGGGSGSITWDDSTNYILTQDPIIHQNNYAPGSTTVWIAHVNVSNPITVDTAYFYIGTALGAGCAGGGTCGVTVGIYSTGCASLLAQATPYTSSSGTGVQSVAFSPAVTLSEPSYCIAVATDSAVLTLSANYDGSTVARTLLNGGVSTIGQCTNTATGNGGSLTLPTCGTITTGSARLYNIKLIP